MTRKMKTEKKKKKKMVNNESTVQKLIPHHSTRTVSAPLETRRRSRVVPEAAETVSKEERDRLSTRPR